MKKEAQTDPTILENGFCALCLFSPLDINFGPLVKNRDAGRFSDPGGPTR